MNRYYWEPIRVFMKVLSPYRISPWMNKGIAEELILIFYICAPNCKTASDLQYSLFPIFNHENRYLNILNPRLHDIQVKLTSPLSRPDSSIIHWSVCSKRSLLLVEDADGNEANGIINFTGHQPENQSWKCLSSNCPSYFRTSSCLRKSIASNEASVSPTLITPRGIESTTFDQLNQ